MLNNELNRIPCYEAETFIGKKNKPYIFKDNILNPLKLIDLCMNNCTKGIFMKVEYVYWNETKILLNPVKMLTIMKEKNHA